MFEDIVSFERSELSRPLLRAKFGLIEKLRRVDAGQQRLHVGDDFPPRFEIAAGDADDEVGISRRRHAKNQRLLVGRNGGQDECQPLHGFDIQHLIPISNLR